jgi:hypothetical protein
VAQCQGDTAAVRGSQVFCNRKEIRYEAVPAVLVRIFGDRGVTVPPSIEPHHMELRPKRFGY